MADNEDYNRGQADPYNDDQHRVPMTRRSESPGRMEVDGGRAANGYGDDRNGHGAPARNGGEGRGRNEEGTNPGSNLHVSGLSPKVEQRHLEELFGTVGRVEKASVMYDPHTRESRGFGFVMMATPEDAANAVAELDKKELQGKIITVAIARRARARTPTPGRYFGPPKTAVGYAERPYQPRSYDSRYSERGPPRGYDDRERRYDDRPPRYDDRRGGDHGRSYDDRSRAYDYRDTPAARDYRAPAYDDRRRPDDRAYDRGARY